MIKVNSKFSINLATKSFVITPFFVQAVLDFIHFFRAICSNFSSRSFWWIYMSIYVDMRPRKFLYHIFSNNPPSSSCVVGYSVPIYAISKHTALCFAFAHLTKFIVRSGTFRCSFLTLVAPFFLKWALSFNLKNCSLFSLFLGVNCNKPKNHFLCSAKRLQFAVSHFEALNLSFMLRYKKILIIDYREVILFQHHYQRSWKLVSENVKMQFNECVINKNFTVLPFAKFNPMLAKSSPKTNCENGNAVA